MDPILGMNGLGPRRARELFHHGVVGTGNTCLPWTVPKNASMVYMMAIGAGGGGGAGFTAPTSTVKAGGGGGGSGGSCRFLIPAAFLPRQLNLWAGNGGAGGSASGSAGAGGAHSFVADATGGTISTGLPDIIIASGSSVSGGGAAGSSALAAGGAAETVLTIAGSPIYTGVGLLVAHAGPLAGSPSSITTSPSGQTWGTNNAPGIVTGGGSGSSVTAANAFVAGSVVACVPNNSGNLSNVQGANNASGNGGVGGAGTMSSGRGMGISSWIFLGGAGGGASSNATGGQGGKGATGCGGGGGGAGITGGPGGDGGPGLIYIAWW
jgi:hypothetical protein